MKTIGKVTITETSLTIEDTSYNRNQILNISYQKRSSLIGSIGLFIIMLINPNTIFAAFSIPFKNRKYRKLHLTFGHHKTEWCYITEDEYIFLKENF